MNRLSSTNNIWRRVIIFSFLILCIGTVYYFARNYISIDMLKQHGNQLRLFVHDRYIISVLIYMGLYITLLACSLPFVAPLAVAGGYLFGIKVGFLYAVLSTMVGAGIGFLFLRYFMTPEALSEKHKKFKNLEEKLKENGVLYLLMLNFTSVVPVAVINTVAVLADMSLLTVLWTTGVGSIPFIGVYTHAGSQLKTASSFRDFFSPKLFIILALLGLAIIIVSKVVKRWSR